uniref:aminoglycoside phosphotransferase family protein n=1 Tax=Psychrobacter sp. TaxID=56811 RepID=UPI0025CDDABC
MTVSSVETYHTKQRYNQLSQFIKATFPNQLIRIESLPGDASFRRYHRIYLEGLDNNGNGNDKVQVQDIAQLDPILDPSYIVMDAPPQLESIESFVRINTLMISKINVPSLFAEDMDQGFLILQDFGSIEFAHLIAEAKVKQDSGRINDLYRWAIDSLIHLQALDIAEAKNKFNVPDYDAATLQREMELFTEWFLPYIDQPLDSETTAIWQNFTHALIEQLLQQPQVVVHRDYHSRNLMQDQYHIRELGVIDFQDALIGSYTYDLVSLVRDAYVDWSEAEVDSWIEYFWQQCKSYNKATPDNLKQFTTQVNLMGVQRHLKVLGIFVRLSERDGKTRYLSDIPKVWQDLMVEMIWLNEHADEKIKTFIQPALRW